LYRSFAAFAFVALAATSCSGGVTGTSTPPPPSDPATETYAASLGVNLASMTKVSNDLYTKDLTVGTGVVALNTHSVTVIYTGYFVNGTQFDSNVGGTPFQFFLGTGEVIPGWDQGMAGMRVGGKRLLVVGSTLGYGSVPHGSIPASSTLVFTVQLTSVQ
jgi:FKBP-type peptidyl-prolyl cis-trans isomerase